MRRIATALLLLVASMSAPPAFAVSGVDSAAQAVIRDAGDNRLVMIGELHGTSEVPALVAALARHYVHSGPVLVALEVHAAEHPRIRAYLASDGGVAARHALRDSGDSARQFDQWLTLPRLTPSPLLEPRLSHATAAGR